MRLFIIRAVQERKAMVDYLLSRIPGALVAYDQTRNAMDTFMQALALAGDGPAVHMEEDVLLTKGFLTKIAAAIAERPDQPIQFFSMRKADLEVGSREEPGRTFLMGQCFYLPAGMSKRLMGYDWPRIKEHPTGLDMMVADYLQHERICYWIHVPNLVDHRVGVSAIDSRRSSRRQSFTFTDPDEDMKKIPYSEALRLWKEGADVYLLHDDGTESLATSALDVAIHDQHGGEFGIDK